FFQAEDGIRDFHVTGVQTCALPIYFQKNHGIQIDEVETEPAIFYSTKHKRYENNSFVSESEVERTINLNFVDNKEELVVGIAPRSEERRVGKECRYRRTASYKKRDK